MTDLFIYIYTLPMDDILHNTIGALLGAIGALFITALLNKRTSQKKVE